jgi:hypothetical protein
MENTEIWKDIQGYEGLYQISNFGSVKSLSRLNDNGMRKYISKERILKASLNDGYYVVRLYKDKKGKTMKVHILVAMAFLGHKPDGTTKIVVDHINNIKTDNMPENLQLISHRQNVSKDINKGVPTGVYIEKRTGKYVARIQHEYKQTHLGTFDCPTAAHFAYLKALKQISKAI